MRVNTHTHTPTDIFSFPYFSAYRAIFAGPIITPCPYPPTSLARSSHHLDRFFPGKPDITLREREIRLRNAHSLHISPRSEEKPPPFFRGCSAAAMLGRAAVLPIFFLPPIFFRPVFSSRGPKRSRRQNSLTPVIHRASTSSNTPPVTYAGWLAIVKVTTSSGELGGVRCCYAERLRSVHSGLLRRWRDERD